MENVITFEDASQYVRSQLSVFDEIKNDQHKVKSLLDEVEEFNKQNGWVGIIYDLSEYIYGWYLKQSGDENAWDDEACRVSLEEQLNK